mgnify:CR=1 FL=1
MHLHKVDLNPEPQSSIHYSYIYSPEKPKEKKPPTRSAAMLAVRARDGFVTFKSELRYSEEG